MAALLRSANRNALFKIQQLACAKNCIQPMGTEIAYDEMKEFWSKNRRLNRPLSPHLSIYKPQLTSMLSLCHRVTGIVMSVSVTSVAAALLFLPNDFATYVNIIKDLELGGVILTTAKYVLAFPVIYHYINGMRHLAWDWAKGFSLTATYQTGYFVFALAWLLTIYAVHFL